MTIRTLFHGTQQMAWKVRVAIEMLWERDHRSDRYTRRVNALHRILRVPPDYGQRGLPFHREALELVAAPCSPDGRQCLMTPTTRSQWLALQRAAASSGVVLLVKWGFRSIDEQAQLIRDQLSCGGEIDQLLTWIAAPGFSEHHTGRALDFDCVPAEKEFEKTRAFDWLCLNAREFGFVLSYPKDNAYGIIFEPWHWCCHTAEASPVP